MDSGTVLRGRGGGWGAVRLFWDACRICVSSTLVWVDRDGLYICAAVVLDELRCNYLGWINGGWETGVLVSGRCSTACFGTV